MMVDKVPAVLELEVDTDHLPRYNMRRAALRPPPSAWTRVLATPQSESTSVQAKPSGPAPQIDEVVIALAQAAAAIATQGRATEPGPLVAAVDLKHADLQQLVGSDLLLTLMPEAALEGAAGEDLIVESRPLPLSVDPSPLDLKPCAGSTSPTDVISAAAGWSVPSRSRAEPLTPILAPRICIQPILAPRDSEQCKHWTPLIAHAFPKTIAPTPPAEPLRLVAHLSTRKIRTVAWEEHSKPKHVLDEDMLGEGEAAARKHVSAAADPGSQLPWSFWQARH